MTAAIAPFYDSLDLSLVEARSTIEQGSSERRSAAHTPVVATLDANGFPSQRVMILREVNWDLRQLRFHTDARSIKMEQLAANGSASVLFYDSDAKIQLRLAGRAYAAADGVAADRAWGDSTLFARRCYLAESAPGSTSSGPVSGLPLSVEGRQPDADEISPARANFAILLFEFDDIEWLYLANAGHRRARWRWDGAEREWQGNWLIP